MVHRFHPQGKLQLITRTEHRPYNQVGRTSVCNKLPCKNQTKSNQVKITRRARRTVRAANSKLVDTKYTIIILMVVVSKVPSNSLRYTTTSTLLTILLRSHTHTRMSLLRLHLAPSLFSRITGLLILIKFPSILRTSLS